MKKIIALAAILSLFSMSSQAGEIGVLDIEQIVKESDAMKYVQNKITDKQEEYQKDIDKKQSALEKEQKRIEAKKNILSADAFEKKVKEFEEEVRELKDFVEKRQNTLRKASLDSMGKINDEIKEIITDISKERGFDIIIPASQALYYKEKYDISEEVLKRLNKKLTKVPVTFSIGR